MIVGGCSLAKLGNEVPGGTFATGCRCSKTSSAGSAMLVQKDDGKSPVVRLDSVGKHDVGAGGAQAAILSELVSKPLERLGLGYADIDKYATEMHNPEVTEPAGSGNVPELNYKLIAALAVRAGQLGQGGNAGFCGASRHDRLFTDAGPHRVGDPVYAPRNRRTVQRQPEPRDVPRKREPVPGPDDTDVGRLVVYHGALELKFGFQHCRIGPQSSHRLTNGKEKSIGT